MPYARPSLTQLRAQAIEDIQTSGVPGLDGLLRNAVMRVLAMVMSGLAYLVYGYLDWISREAVPFTATDEYLEAWAGLVGIYRKDATSATGAATFTGNPAMILPAGAALTRYDGVPFATTAEGVISQGGSVTVPIIATITGAATNGADGAPLNIDNPVAGINAAGLLAGPATGGTDQETDADFRTRMLERYRDPPQGGAAADYVEWATAVPGCTRAWVLPGGYGPGTVVVYPMFDAANAASGGFPIGTDGCATDETRGPTATGDQLAVADAIWPVQPVTALVYVSAPNPCPINITLAALDPNTPDMQAAIVAAVSDALFTASVGGTIYPSDLYDAILATPGIIHFTMTSPAGAVVVPMGSLPVMGSLTVVG